MTSRTCVFLMVSMFVFVWPTLKAYAQHASFGQFVDSCIKESELLNKTDTFGKRQGKWVFVQRVHPHEYEFNVTSGFFKDDIPVGVWTVQTRNGSIIKRNIYLDSLNSQMQVITYATNGVITSIGLLCSIPKDIDDYPKIRNAQNSWEFNSTKKYVEHGAWVYYDFKTGKTLERLFNYGKEVGKD